MQDNKDMNLIQIEGEIKNSNILFLILGVLLVPTINSIESIVFGISKLVFMIFPIKTLGIFSLIFHGLILLAVVILLFKLFRKNEIPATTISLNAFRVTGLAFALLIFISSIINLYIKTHFKEAIDLSMIEYIDNKDLAYLSLISSGLITIRNIILFVTFLVIVFGQKHYRQQSL